MFSAVLRHFFPKVAQNITAFCEEQKLSKYMVVSYKCGSFIAFHADYAGMPICLAIQTDIVFGDVCNAAPIFIGVFLSTSACCLPDWN
jgi:hypothetical protein